MPLRHFLSTLLLHLLNPNPSPLLCIRVNLDLRDKVAGMPHKQTLAEDYATRKAPGALTLPLFSLPLGSKIYLT